MRRGRATTRTPTARTGGLPVRFARPAVRLAVRPAVRPALRPAVRPAARRTVGLASALTLALAACAAAEPGPSPFTDSDLQALRDARRPFVVYVWSPHMPLSVAGYSEIARAAVTLEVTVVPLLFTGSDRDFAGREAARVGIPDAGLREVASDELAAGNALVHAPTVLLFDGARAAPVLPGYRNAAGYREFIEEFLGR